MTRSPNKDQSKIRSIKIRSILLMADKKGIRSGIWHAFHQYAKANDKYLKCYDKNKNYLYLNY